MDELIEDAVRNNTLWTKLPDNVKQAIGSNVDYDKKVIEYSIKNQLRFRGNLVRQIKKNEKSYYDDLLRYSREHLMLFPYHLSDFIVTGMRITPFQYYVAMVQDILEQEKSYDTLPNFTAADCLRLLGIGRNQYIEIMNSCRSSKRFLGMIKKPIKDSLPSKPVKDIPIEPWWILYPGYITEEDVKLMVADSEKLIIDAIVGDISVVGPVIAGDHDEKDIRSLYLKGLIYLDVPVKDDDLIVVPPLEGFVMNRITGDYFETLLYKIFISLDEKTTVAELASILQIDLQLVKNAISMYCRLGFAYKKSTEIDPNQYHPSWRKKRTLSILRRETSHEKTDMENFFTALSGEQDSGKLIEDALHEQTSLSEFDQTNNSNSVLTTSGSIHSKRLALLYDSTLAAFLMMGNLSSGLKNHAVTMFEVGKLPDESIDSLLMELSKINSADMEDEGSEAERYFLHALMLKKSIEFLRNNSGLTSHLNDDPTSNNGLGLDLIRCESLLNLDAEICQKLLQKNYKLLISIAPLSKETKLISSHILPHLGPASPLINSIWFKLYLYSISGYGPPCLLLPKGVRLTKLPEIFEQFEILLVTPLGRDSATIPVTSSLLAINETLVHSSLLVQGYSSITNGDELVYVVIPLQSKNDDNHQLNPFQNHPAVKAVINNLNFEDICGYITLLNIGNITTDENKLNLNVAGDESANNFQSEFQNWTLLDCNFGIPLFDRYICKVVLQRILENGLCNIESLKKLVEFNNKLCLSMQTFVSQHQEKKFLNSDVETITTERKDPKHHFTFPPSTKYESVVPLPNYKLFFNNGIIHQLK